MHKTTMEPRTQRDALSPPPDRLRVTHPAQARRSRATPEKTVARPQAARFPAPADYRTGFLEKGRAPIAAGDWGPSFYPPTILTMHTVLSRSATQQMDAAKSGERRSVRRLSLPRRCQLGSSEQAGFVPAAAVGQIQLEMVQAVDLKILGRDPRRHTERNARCTHLRNRETPFASAEKIEALPSRPTSKPALRAAFRSFRAP